MAVETPSAECRTPTALLIFHAGIEPLEADEAAAANGLGTSLRSISKNTYKSSGHPLRSVHTKSHALLYGETEILGGLPWVLPQGLFATPPTYPVSMRVSTVPGDVLDDNVSVRAVWPSRSACRASVSTARRTRRRRTSSWFKGPVFGAPPTGKAFLKKLKLLAGTTDRAEGAKKALSTVLQSVESLVEAFGGKSPTLIQIGGRPENNPLGETYFTQAPHLYGDYVAKFALFLVLPELIALTDAKVDLSGKPNGLRQAAIDFFHAHGGVWELRAQLCTDLETMPVEDSTVEWPQDKSPYITVARVTATPQEAWSEAKARVFDDGLSFSPWHGIAAHRPLGSIMRLRKSVYKMSARFRFERNGCPVHEPRAEIDGRGKI